MIFVGIGSNLGSRKLNIRRAVDRLRQLGNSIRISSLYESDALLPDAAPADWNKSFLNCVVALETSLSPREFLTEAKKIESELGRKDRKPWAPREIDIDILVWDGIEMNEPGLVIPHPGLVERPFALLPLIELEPKFKHTEKWGEKVPFGTHKISEDLMTPELVGILNVTPDSFSDGGKYLNPEKASAQIETLVQGGAHIIDIGAESTRPGARLLTAEEEWLRLQPVLNAVISEIPKNISISIDTRHAETARKALKMGASWINDVSGFQDPEMCKAVADSEASLVFMHNLGVPPTKEKVFSESSDVISELMGWARERISALGKYGITKDRLIFDPGIGFGKTSTQSFTLLKNIDSFLKLDLRILVGHSRKSFMSSLTDRPFSERDVETLALSLELAKKGVHYLRVHNVEWHSRAFKALSGFHG